MDIKTITSILIPILTFALGVLYNKRDQKRKEYNAAIAHVREAILLHLQDAKRGYVGFLRVEMAEIIRITEILSQKEAQEFLDVYMVCLSFQELDLWPEPGCNEELVDQLDRQIITASENLLRLIPRK